MTGIEFHNAVVSALDSVRPCCDESGFFARGSCRGEESPYRGTQVVFCKGDALVVVAISDQEEVVSLSCFNRIGYPRQAASAELLQEVMQVLRTGGIVVRESDLALKGGEA